MTVFLWILAAVAALLLLVLLLLKVGVRAEYGEDGIFVDAVAGPVKIRLHPREPKEEKKEKQKKSKKEKPAAEKKKGGTLDLLKELWPALKEALSKFRRKLTVDELTLHLTVAGDSAAKTAVRYGQASAAMGVMLSLLEQLVHIRERDVGTAVDFEAESMTVYAKAQLTLRVWHLIYIAIGPLGALLRQKKERK